MSAQKESVLKDIETAWQALQDVLASVPSERMEVSGVVESWSMKDVTGHITTWESEAIKSLQSYLQHNNIKMLAWSTDLNVFNTRTSEKRSEPGHSRICSTI